MGSSAAKNGDARVQVLDDIDNSDLKAARNEYLYRTPGLVTALAPMLKDQRDLPMLCLILNIVEVVVPGLVLIFSINMWEPPLLPLWVRNLLGLAYVLTNVLLFQERFTLMLHFASHRAIFKNECLNGILNWVFAPLFGIPCGVYKLHHVIMHHIENNHELDTSSTERYQRDSLLDFFRYWFHFAVLIWVELPCYTIRTQRYTWFGKLLWGALIWVTIMTLLARYVSPLATLWAFVVPHVLAMSVMAFGNFAQHMFVNPEDCQSNFALTYNCMDTKVNQTTFNDGYHIVHHLNARLHWTEMPEYFYQTRDRHLQGGALTFRGVHFFDVGILVFSGRLRKLAECYVHLGPRETAPTVEAIEAKLRAWLRPVEAAAAGTAAKKAQ